MTDVPRLWCIGPDPAGMTPIEGYAILATNVIPAQAGTPVTLHHRLLAPYSIMNTPAMTTAMAG